MLESSFRLGTISGIRIGVHYTWLIIFFLLVTSLFSMFSMLHAEWSMTAVLVSAVITTLLFFTSIVLHELGHSLVAIARGIRVRSITLFKHIPVYYPEHVGSVGGIVGLIGGLGGFFLPVAFGIMNDTIGVWTSCFMLLTILIGIALTWMHLAVQRLEREKNPHLAEPGFLPELEEIQRAQAK